MRQRINKKGLDFSRKVKTDSLVFMLISGPIFLVICFFFLKGYGYEKYYLVIPPVIFILFMFYFTPLIKRKSIVNSIIYEIEVNKSIQARTFSYFSNKHSDYTFQKQDIVKIKKTSLPLLDKPEAFLISFKLENKTEELYLIPSFFDNLGKTTLDILHNKFY